MIIYLVLVNKDKNKGYGEINLLVNCDIFQLLNILHSFLYNYLMYAIKGNFFIKTYYYIICTYDYYLIFFFKNLNLMSVILCILRIFFRPPSSIFSFLDPRLI